MGPRKETVLHSFSQFGGDGAFPWYGTLAKDSSGNLYGTTWVGGPGGRFGTVTVFKINASGKETILYSFTGTNGDGFPQDGVVRDRPAIWNGRPKTAARITPDGVKVDPPARKRCSKFYRLD